MNTIFSICLWSVVLQWNSLESNSSPMTWWARWLLHGMEIITNTETIPSWFLLNLKVVYKRQAVSRLVFGITIWTTIWSFLKSPSFSTYADKLPIVIHIQVFVCSGIRSGIIICTNMQKQLNFFAVSCIITVNFLSNGKERSYAQHDIRKKEQNIPELTKAILST